MAKLNQISGILAVDIRSANEQCLKMFEEDVDENVFALQSIAYAVISWMFEIQVTFFAKSFDKTS